MADEGIKFRVVKQSQARVVGNLKKIRSDSFKLLPQAIQQTAVQIQTDAKKNAPVMFGLLRSSIYIDYRGNVSQKGSYQTSVTRGGKTMTLRQVMRTPSAQSDKNGLNAYVGSDLDYAELQNSKTGFLTKAYDKHAPRLEKSIDKIITQLVK